ncbi:MAG TPA: hypothetical protein VMP89_20655 [Solirubrobacteraceae bacterium]|nr:hypothetical protein [Solirubrobacteraceae bacterium]
MNRGRASGADPRRIAPVLLAGVLAAAYVIVSPPSGDLAAHMLRAKLFATEGFGIWNNWWYAGHHVLLYSVLFPPLAAALTPQLVAAIAATGSAALFEPLARRHFGEQAWLGSLWFAAATATSLYTGRLTFAFGMLPAVAAVLALQRGRPWLAALLAFLTALSSPVAAVFAALAGAAAAIAALAAERRIRPALPGAGVVLAALLPIVALAVAFPEGGTEPFVFSAFWPLPLLAIGLAVLIPRYERALLAGAALYTVAVIVSYAVPSALGSNAARLAELLVGPLAALILWPRRKALLVAVAVPLLYLQWHAPIGDLATAGGPSTTNAYYRPLLAFLDRQPGPPFRVEIAFTKFHWEAYAVAPQFPLARGWERQLDIKYDHLFYERGLTPASYERWLHSVAVRFVALPDAPLDYSALAERTLIERGLPYLRLVRSTRHWRIYAVADATPIVQGAATLRALGPNSLTLHADHPGDVLVRVHFTPYWAITEGSGCVAPAGQFTRLTLRRAGPVRVTISFSLGRIGARSPRCT